MKFKTDGKYRGNIVLAEGFIRSEMYDLSDLELKLYLSVLMFAHGNSEPELSAIAHMMHTDVENIILLLKKLEKKHLLALSSTTVKILSSQTDEVGTPSFFKEYTPEEIAQMDDKDITMLVQTAEKAFGKLLSYGEMSVLISLYRWIGISPSVLVVLIEYVAALGKRSIGYLKKVALDWNEKEIDTPAKAHAYITYLEQQKDYYTQMRLKLGIFGREFTKKEKEYLDTWKQEFSPDQIKETYERTIDNTGKISFAYMNKLLTNDQKPTFEKEAKKPTKKVAPSKFNNFTQKPKDYEAVKAKARERLKKLTENL